MSPILRPQLGGLPILENLGRGALASANAAASCSFQNPRAFFDEEANLVGAMRLQDLFLVNPAITFASILVNFP